MSLILDALNKADRQRERQAPVPNLSTEHAPAKPKVPENSSVPLWAVYCLLSLLLLVVIALGLLLWRGDVLLPKAQAPVNTPSLAPTVGANTSKADGVDFEPVTALAQPLKGLDKKSLDKKMHDNKGREVLPTRAEVPVPALSPEVAAIYRQVGDQAPKASAQASPPPDVSTLYQQGGDQRANQQPNRPAQTADPAPPTTASTPDPLVDEQELQALWRATMAESEAPEPATQNLHAAIPYLHQLPESFKSRIPTLMYQNHIFSASASAVILNGESYRKGDVIAQDLVIEDITEDDLILSYLNKPFRLSALSSWVN
ncbi:MAG TPA: general secretion pathway protein GspB [Marinagarivorans sp.]